MSGELRSCRSPSSATRGILTCISDGSGSIPGLLNESALAALLDVRIALGRDVGKCVRVSNAEIFFLI